MSTNLITCTNKGCYSQDYHKLDIESNDVVCIDCGQSVEISSYMKKMMKSGGHHGFPEHCISAPESSR